MQRRRFLKLSTALLTAPVFSGINGCQQAAPLRIAGQVFPGYALVFLARDEAWLDSRLVEIVETPSAQQSLTALMNNQVDGALLTLDETLKARAQGIPLTIVMIVDRSVGADGLLARPGLQLDELKGKRVGVESGPTAEIMLFHLLKSAGLKDTDLQLVNLPIDQHYPACRDAQLDAVITYQPSLSKIQQLGWQMLFDSRKVDLIYDVLAIRHHQLSVQRKAIKDLIQGHFRALQQWFDNPLDTSYRLARRLNVSAAEVAEQLRGLDLPSLDYNRHLLLTESNPHLMQVAERISQINRIGEPLPSFEVPLFTADFLPERLS